MKYPRRNKFEMAAHEFEINYGKPRPSYDHTIDTYQGNQPTKKIDWFLHLATGAMILFGILMLIAIYG